MPDEQPQEQTQASPPQTGVTLRKRTTEQIEEDLVFIAERLAVRMSIAQIHRELMAVRTYTLGLSQTKKDIKTLHVRWAAGISEGTLMQWKASENHVLDRVEREAMEAWEKSKRDWQSVSGKVTGGASEPAGDRTVTRNRRDGDPRFLDLILKTQERRTKLLGLDAPVKLDANIKYEGGAALQTLREAYKAKTRAEMLANGEAVVDVESSPVVTTVEH